MQAGHGHVAVVVVQAGQQPHQHTHRVGKHATPDAGMQTMVQGGDLDHAVDQPAQRNRQRRDFGAPIVRVGDDDHVGGQRVAVGGEQPAQRRRPGLFLAFHKDGHAHRRFAAVRPECRQMRCDACLVIGAAAAVQSPVAFGRLERRRYPLTVIAFGLHVVVGIEQHGGRTRRRRIGSDDRRRATLLDDPHVIKTGLRQQVYHPLCAALHLVTPGGVGPHRFDSHQFLEIAPHRRQHLAHPLHQTSHGLPG